MYILYNNNNDDDNKHNILGDAELKAIKTAD